MKALWTSGAIAAACDGAASADFTVDGVTFDSREVKAGDIFIAMRGEKADGHAYVEGAHANGAAGFLVEQPVPYPHVVVADGFAALRALGRAGRARTRATVIGVTGSVGKTGSKEALRLSFERIAPGRAHASEKSYNNHTGVPLSLARMPADSRYGVFEMGMNHSGELSDLTRMVRPHVALVTWVGAAHIGFFASEEAIAEAKAEIFEGVEPGGAGIWPADNPHAGILKAKIDSLKLGSLSFGFSPDADVRAISAVPSPRGTEVIADVAGRELHLTVGMAGRHWVSNALGVLATVKAAGGDIDRAAEALADLTGLPGRGARVVLDVGGGEAILIDESYNANPVSMAAAIAVLAEMPGRRLALLGAMRELGDRSAELHAGLRAPLTAAGVAEIALVGREMESLAIDGASYLPDADAALAWAKAVLKPGDILLVKGSNGVGLSRVVAALQSREGGE